MRPGTSLEHDHLLNWRFRHYIVPAPPAQCCSADRKAEKLLVLPGDACRIFQMTDSQWDTLNIPIHLAFFFHSTSAERVVLIPASRERLN